MELWQWTMPLIWPRLTSWDLLSLLERTGSGGGIDTTTLWLLLSGAGSTITALASLLYKNERDRRIEAEAKLEKFQEIAPDLAENVRWLVEEAQEERASDLPWPVRRGPARPSRSTPRRRP